MAAHQKQLPDALLAEVWAVMHLAVAGDMGNPGSNEHVAGGRMKYIESGFQAEGHVEMESDSPFDLDESPDNATLKETAHTLVSIGDAYNEEKQEENNVVDDIVNCLRGKAPGIDERLERELNLSKPDMAVFQEKVVSSAYMFVKSRLETFLVGDEGFSKIAMVTHITKGVSAALRNVSAPAVSLAAAISYRFVTEEYGDLILQSGGLTNLVKSNSQ